jgi:RimJ/RimL family protein N-acetyltransferase
MHLAITDRTTEAYVGEAVLSDIDQDNRSCSFRIALVNAEVTGRGYGTQATQLVIDYALGPLGLHRVELEVLAFNPRARRVYEKVGFVTEGLKRQAVRWNGEWVDVELMAILATDG